MRAIVVLAIFCESGTGKCDVCTYVCVGQVRVNSRLQFERDG